MDPNTEKFIQGKRVAVVGASRAGNKFGNSVYKELKNRGYEVKLVHPSAGQIEGETCYPSLMEIKDQVDGVFVCVQPAQAEQVVRQAADAGLRNIWLQQGAESPAAVEAARQLEMNAVSGKCILMYASPVTGIHNFHRAIVKLFGKL